MEAPLIRIKFCNSLRIANIKNQYNTSNALGEGLCNTLYTFYIPVPFTKEIAISMRLRNSNAPLDFHRDLTRITQPCKLILKVGMIEVIWRTVRGDFEE